MTTFYKYPLRLASGPQQILTHGSGIVHHVGCQDGVLYVWIAVDPDAELVPAVFQVIGTGQPWPDGGMWVGTCQCPPFVWHVFELER